ncbi:MAG TPA: phage holin family protein [Opitutaceae bacterium]|nr:phage holin family protein [Opitutaceae bacterium]
MDAVAGSKSSSLLSAAGALIESLLGSAQNRIQVLSVELQEEKYRFIQTLILVGAVVFAGMMTIAFATLTVVYLFWENARVAALGGVTAFYAIGLLFVSLKLKHFLSTQPKPFSATLGELTKDRACFPPAN